MKAPKPFTLIALIIVLAFFLFQKWEKQAHKVADFDLQKLEQAVQNHWVEPDSIRQTAEGFTGSLNDEGQKAFGGKYFEVQAGISESSQEAFSRWIERGAAPTMSELIERLPSPWETFFMKWLPLGLIALMLISKVRKIAGGKMGPKSNQGA